MKKSFLILLTLSCQYLLATSSFFLNENIENKNFFLKKGTKVQLIKTLENDKVKIDFPLFLDKDKNLFFSKNMTYKIGFLKKSKNQKVDFIINKNQLSNDSLEVWEEAEELYLDACTQCHAQMDPPEHSMLEWEGIFDSMKEQTQLDETEQKQVLDYLKSHSANGFIKEE